MNGDNDFYGIKDSFATKLLEDSADEVTESRKDQATLVEDADTSLVSIYSKCYINFNDVEVLSDLKRIRTLTIQPNPPIDQIVDAGIIPEIVQLIRRTRNNEIIFEALWILTNIAAFSTAETMEIVNNGGVGEMVRLLNLNDFKVQQQAAWGLGNISADCTAARDAVLHSGCVVPLIQLAVHPRTPMSTVRIVAWVFTNLCRGKRPVFNMVSPSLPLLVKFIHSNDISLIYEATESFSYLSDGSWEQGETLLKLKIIGRLVELLYHPKRKVVASCLRTLGKIVMGSAEHTEAVLNAGFLRALLRILEMNNDIGLITEACWAASNIAAGTVDQIESLCNSGLIPVAIKYVHDGPLRSRREASWIIVNALSCGSTSIKKSLTSPEVVHAICSCLDLHEHDPSLVLQGLKNLHELLQFGCTFNSNPIEYTIHFGSGVEYISHLRYSANEEISARAREICETFFELPSNHSPSRSSIESDDGEMNLKLTP